MVFDEFKVGNLVLNNRIIAEPVVSNSILLDGNPSEKTFEIYANYVQSGAGLVVVEQHAVHPWGRNKMSQFRLYYDLSAESLQGLTSLFADKGVLVVAQLNFSGAGASGKELLLEEDFELVSPSGVRNPRDLIGADSRALTKIEIQDIVDSFASSAKRAVEISNYTGGVQIYGCHGYLLGQFLSPLTNLREDSYGGNLKNRARLLFEVVEAVRGSVPYATLSVRLGAADQMPNCPEHGLTISESTWVAKELVSLGIDWLGVSGNHCIFGIGEDDKDTGYFESYSAAIRKGIDEKIPVDCAGGIRSARKAMQMLENGSCDLIGFGRPLVTDSEYIHKMRREYAMLNGDSWIKETRK